MRYLSFEYKRSTAVDEAGAAYWSLLSSRLLSEQVLQQEPLLPGAEQWEPVAQKHLPGRELTGPMAVGRPLPIDEIRTLTV